MYGFDHAGMGLSALGMILFWLVPIALIVLLFARIQPKGTRAVAPTPVDILDERYARGEVEQDEYRLRRSDLLQSDANHGAKK